MLERLDVPAAHAREVAACLIKAELRGVDSHGLVRLPVYARRIQAGVVNARPDIRMRPSGPRRPLVDGDNGLGPVVGARAMEAALDLARSHGTGFVGVRHSNHFGPAAYYVEKAIERRVHRRGDFQRAAEHGAVRREHALPRHQSRRHRHPGGAANIR